MPHFAEERKSSYAPSAWRSDQQHFAGDFA
jgi:hypothetical protein